VGIEGRDHIARRLVTLVAPLGEQLADDGADGVGELGVAVLGRGRRLGQVLCQDERDGGGSPVSIS